MIGGSNDLRTVREAPRYILALPQKLRRNLFVKKELQDSSLSRSKLRNILSNSRHVAYLPEADPTDFLAPIEAIDFAEVCGIICYERQ